MPSDFAACELMKTDFWDFTLILGYGKKFYENFFEIFLSYFGLYDTSFHFLHKDDSFRTLFG